MTIRIIKNKVKQFGGSFLRRKPNQEHYQVIFGDRKKASKCEEWMLNNDLATCLRSAGYQWIVEFVTG
jgi:hypothetical protein